MFLKKKKDNTEKLNDVLSSNNNISEYSKPKDFDLKNKSPFSKIIKILVIILIISVVGFLLFLYLFMGNKDNSKNSNTADNIQLNIISTNIDLDGKLSYTISFKNNQSASIEYANLEVRLPHEFIVLDSDIPYDSISDNYAKWSFKNIQPGSEIKFNINGMIIGKIGSEVVLSSSLDYKLSNVSSTFTSSSDYSVLITKSLMDVVVDRPEKIEANKEFKYKIKVRNNSNRVFNNIGIKFSYNNTYFNVLSSSDEPQDKGDSDMLFVFDLNKPVDNTITDVNNDDYYQKIITIDGVITNDKISNADFDINTGIFKDMSNFDSIEYVIERHDSFQLANSGFTLNVSSNFNIQDLNGDKVALIDDISKQYKLTLKYKKESNDVTFKNARVVLEITGDNLLNFDKGKCTPDTVVTRNEQSGLMDNILEWSYGKINSLKDISINENTIDISIPFDESFITSKNGIKSAVVNLSVYGFDNSNTEILLYKNPSFKIIVDSGFNILAKPNYYDENGNQIGFGPNPPKVGQETKYRVDFNIGNKYNNLSNIVMNIQLPKYVRYSSDYSTSNGFDLVYDDKTNIIKWDINSMNKGDSVTGFFFVYATPTKDMVNKQIQVIDKINVQYMDNDLNMSMSKDFGPITGDKVTN